MTFKKIKLTALLVVLASQALVYGQNLFPASGNSYIGSGSSNGANLQIHGTSPYNLVVPTLYDINGVVTQGYTANYGITSRLSFTNTTTGASETDGVLMRMSEKNFSLVNLEKESLLVKSNGAYLNFSGATNRIWGGMAPMTLSASNFGYLNLRTSDNGIYLRSTGSGKYGLSIDMHEDEDLAIRVVNSGTGTGNISFGVQSNGEVYARKYTTTLNNIPDYVFRPDYNLMTFSDLRDFIKSNQHLPNIPSAKVYEEKGVDLGEMNRLLLEKVEELTLYVLELEERMNIVENDQN